MPRRLRFPGSVCELFVEHRTVDLSLCVGAQSTGRVESGEVQPRADSTRICAACGDARSSRYATRPRLPGTGLPTLRTRPEQCRARRLTRDEAEDHSAAPIRSSVCAVNAGSCGGFRLCRDPLIKPVLNIGHDVLFPHVVEQIVIVPLVQLERLVRRTGSVVEILAALVTRRLLVRPVNDPDRNA